jgi:hypothetical protein
LALAIAISDIPAHGRHSQAPADGVYGTEGIQVPARGSDSVIEQLFTMSVASRCVFVPAAVVAVFLLAGSVSASAEAGQDAPAAPRRVGTAAIDHTTKRDDATPMTHLQQQLTRVTGVAEPRPADIETLTRALDAARSRPIARARLIALAEALAGALAQGQFEEVTIQRIAEDLYAALNNKALTTEQAALVAVDVAAALQDAGAVEPHVTIVLNALQGVCPEAVMPAEGLDAKPGAPGQSRTPAKRSLLTLSRDSSE